MRAQPRTILVLLSIGAAVSACRTFDHERPYAANPPSAHVSDPNEVGGANLTDRPEYAQTRNGAPYGTRSDADQAIAREKNAPLPPEDPNHFGRTPDDRDPDKRPIDAPVVLGLLLASDDHEVLAAMEAEKRTLPDAVLTFARMLHQQHSEHQTRTLELGRKLDIPPATGGAVDARRMDDTKVLAHLASLPDHDFPREYVEAMVAGQERLVRDLEEKLLPVAKQDELREHLKATRVALERQIQEGKRLQSELPR